MVAMADEQTAEARARLAGVTWECKATRWSKPVRLARDGRIGSQMRGVKLGRMGRIYLYSVDQLVGYVNSMGDVFITTEKFQLPQHILNARVHHRRLRESSTYSITTECHKSWFAQELAGVGRIHRVSQRQLLDQVAGSPDPVPTANFGRESRYGV